MSNKDSWELLVRKAERFNLQETYRIQRELEEQTQRAKRGADVKLWFLANGVDLQLISYVGHDGTVNINTNTYEADGRLNDQDLADLRKKLKKAPFKFTIQGVKQ